MRREKAYLLALTQALALIASRGLHWARKPLPLRALAGASTHVDLLRFQARHPSDGAAFLGVCAVLNSVSSRYCDWHSCTKQFTPNDRVTPGGPHRQSSRKDITSDATYSYAFFKYNTEHISPFAPNLHCSLSLCCVDYHSPPICNRLRAYHTYTTTCTHTHSHKLRAGFRRVPFLLTLPPPFYQVKLCYLLLQWYGLVG